MGSYICFYLSKFHANRILGYAYMSAATIEYYLGMKVFH